MRTSSTRQRISTTAFAVVALMTIAVTVAYACTNLATLNLSSSSVSPGDKIAITGSSFGAEVPVVLHWNSVEGEEVATVTPDSAGNISAAVTVPDAQPGYYVIVATQINDEGSQQFGGPARAAVEVVGPAGPTLDTAPAGQPLAQFAGDTGASSSGLLALTIALGVLGVGLFSAGLAGFAKQTRKVEAPTKARVEK